MKKVAILMATYNGEDYIEKQLKTLETFYDRVFATVSVDNVFGERERERERKREKERERERENEKKRGRERVG